MVPGLLYYKNSCYNDKMISWLSLLYHGSLYTWKELYIEMGHWSFVPRGVLITCVNSMLRNCAGWKNITNFLQTNLEHKRINIPHMFSANFTHCHYIWAVWSTYQDLLHTINDKVKLRHNTVQHDNVLHTTQQWTSIILLGFQSHGQAVLCKVFIAFWN